MIYSRNLLANRGTLERMPAPIKRKRFGQITYGNQIVFTVDGEETFKLIYDAISQAESSIYIAGYDLDPSLNFVREGGSNASNMNGYNTSTVIDRHSRNSNSKFFRSVKESVMVDPKSLEEDRAKAVSISATAKSRQNPNSVVTDITTSERRLKGRQAYKRFQELIIEKARKGAVWQPRLPLRILPGADERGLDGRAQEAEILNKLAKNME
jgi:hypothetical protein